MERNEAAERLRATAADVEHMRRTLPATVAKIEADARRATVERIRDAMVPKVCTCGDGRHRPSWRFCKGYQVFAILDEEAAR